MMLNIFSFASLSSVYTFWWGVQMLKPFIRSLIIITWKVFGRRKWTWMQVLQFSPHIKCHYMAWFHMILYVHVCVCVSTLLTAVCEWRPPEVSAVHNLLHCFLATSLSLIRATCRPSLPYFHNSWGCSALLPWDVAPPHLLGIRVFTTWLQLTLPVPCVVVPTFSQS